METFAYARLNVTETPHEVVSRSCPSSFYDGKEEFDQRWSIECNKPFHHCDGAQHLIFAVSKFGVYAGAVNLFDGNGRSVAAIVAVDNRATDDAEAMALGTISMYINPLRESSGVQLNGPLVVVVQLSELSSYENEMIDKFINAFWMAANSNFQIR